MQVLVQIYFPDAGHSGPPNLGQSNIFMHKTCHYELFCVEHMSEIIDEVELVELNVEHILAKSTCE